MSPSLRTKFRKALGGAFDQPSFDLLLQDYFDQSLDNLSPPGFNKTAEVRYQEVLNQAKMNDWLLDLVAAARERRPKNLEIGAVADEVGLTIAGSRLINKSGSSLEALINANAKFIKMAEFLPRLAQLEGQVCWIKIPGGGGTGFLVGPDLVLTNYHVVDPLLKGTVSPAQVKCQFDYREPIDGSKLTTKKITEVDLHPQQWLLDKQPPSDFDWDPALGDAAPFEADYALIRLSEEIGELPVGGDTVDANATKRGWIGVSEDAPAMVGGNLLFLLQHPSGEPLQLTVGTVKQFNGNGTRMRHDANSKTGSSGSPCFDADLKLTALHHAHDPADPPKWNQAIPFGWIQKLWCKNPAVRDLLGISPCP